MFSFLPGIRRYIDLCKLSGIPNVLKMNSLLVCAIAGCIVAMVAAHMNSPTDNIDVTGYDVKRSLGAACRCCTTRRELGCCNACVFQNRSPTPFYTGKRAIEDKAVLDYHQEEKRARYRSRSQCGCCFTRRLRWCCDSCRRHWYRPGKRSGVEDNPTYDDSDLYLETGNGRDDALTSFSNLLDYYERIPEKESDMSLVDVPAFPLGNVRKDCLCCFLYDNVSCCDRCKNAVWQT